MIMPKNKIPSPVSISPARLYLGLALLVVLIVSYWYLSRHSSEILADPSTLPRSIHFTYANLSSQVHLSETQGILYVPPATQPAHFASIKSRAVRGNHRHQGNDNSISGEVIILLHGYFQFRIGNGDTNTYEDHRFDVSKTGIVALQFPADKCHALKNIGKETNWFASHYIRSKELASSPPVDRQGCSGMILA